MSPYNWNSTNSYANVFFVRNDGYFTNNNVHNTYGLRPIPFYNSCIQLWLNIVELRYKISPQHLLKYISIDILYLEYKITTILFIISREYLQVWNISVSVYLEWQPCLRVLCKFEWPPQQQLGEQHLWFAPNILL